MLQYLIGGVVVVFLVLLVVGGLTGRVKLRNCCSIANPDHDLRMRSTGPDSNANPPASQGTGSGSHSL